MFTWRWARLGTVPPKHKYTVRSESESESEIPCWFQRGDWCVTVASSSIEISHNTNINKLNKIWIERTARNASYLQYKPISLHEHVFLIFIFYLFQKRSHIKCCPNTNKRLHWQLTSTWPKYWLNQKTCMINKWVNMITNPSRHVKLLVLDVSSILLQIKLIPKEYWC